MEKSCGCIIIKNGKVLLVYETNAKIWGFPKGHVEEGETEIETALREVKEEVNLKPVIYEDYKYVINYIVKENVPKEVVYFLADVEEDMVVTRDGEIDMAGWFTQKEALKVLEFDDLKEILNKAFEDSRKI